jgi:hypothetical protein
MKIGCVTAAAAMALLACSHSSGGASNQVSETQRLQGEAVQAFERAAEAQHRASDEQAKAEEAQHQVTEAQRQLAETQARALAQVAKAEQTQREARQLEQQEHAKLSRLQQQALLMQRTEAQTLRQIHQGNLQRWTETKQLTGTALDSSSEVVRVRSRTAGDLPLKLNESTAIIVDGRQTDAMGIQPGSNVRASYQMIDGQPTAVKLDVRSKNKKPTTARAKKPATDSADDKNR